MKEDLPDFSLFSFLNESGNHFGKGIANQKDGAGKFAVGILGVILVVCFLPCVLGWFILSNGFKVSTKTWFYFIVSIIFLFVAVISSLFR